MTSSAVEGHEALDENFIIVDYLSLLLSIIFILALRKQLYKLFPAILLYVTTIFLCNVIMPQHFFFLIILLKNIYNANKIKKKNGGIHKYWNFNFIKQIVYVPYTLSLYVTSRNSVYPHLRNNSSRGKRKKSSVLEIFSVR